MKDHLVKLRMRYRQPFKRPRCRKEESVYLSEEVSISVREIDPIAAPVAFRIYTQDAFPLWHLHEVRSHDRALWWPLMGYDGPMSVAQFQEHAADGTMSSFLTFNPSHERSFPDGPSFAEFVNNFPKHRFGESDRAIQLLRTSRGAARVAFCDGHIFVNAGEPVWYAIGSAVHGGVDLWLGHEALDRENMRLFWTAGPNWYAQRSCCNRSRAFGLGEISSEIKRLAGDDVPVTYRSQIEIVIDQYLPETAALMCARHQLESIWEMAFHRSSLRAAVPLLGAAAVRVVPKDIDAGRMLAQLAAVEDQNFRQTYGVVVVSAQDILRRLDALGCGPLSQEDEDALAALGS
jgi:hypothetical protein